MRSIRSGAIALAALLALLAPAFACGGESEGAAASKEVQRVFPSDRLYTADDLRAAGLKVMREYNVSGLPHAVSAIHGAFNRLEYEARFYSSHSDALAHGLGPADEVSGPDAIVVGPNVKWEEGASHRRLCSRAAETPHSGCSYSARYGDFIVRGNMILLCEGPTSELALIACNDLLKDVP
jgi:hypothetical protein